MAFDPTNAAHRTALNTELTTDPAVLGYAVHVAAQAHAHLASMLTDLAIHSATVDVTTVSVVDVQCAVVGSEWAALTTNQLLLWQTILQLQEGIPTFHANMKAQIQEIWGVGTTTRANLAALQTKTGTRAEELWGDGSRITPSNVADALAL